MRAQQSSVGKQQNLADAVGDRPGLYGFGYATAPNAEMVGWRRLEYR
jgi:hypothetical protein